MSILGRPIVVLPYSKAGCMARLEALVLRWAGRVLWVLVGVLIGIIFE